MLDALNEIRQLYAPRVKALRQTVVGPPLIRLVIYENCSTAGQIGGVIRQYRQALMVHLTDWALAQTPDAQPTKYRVQAWQKMTFGRAVSNSVAVRWCDPTRECGERGALEVSPAIRLACQYAFTVYRGAPDRPLPPMEVELLAATVAGALEAQSPPLQAQA